MQAQIKEWGNSQGIRLPKEILKSAGFALNEVLDVTVANGVITLTKPFRHKTLEERAAEFGGKLMLDGEYDWSGPKFQIVDNQLTPEDFIRLKVATGFMDRPIAQVEKALANDLFDVSVLHDGKVIGMGRLVGDGAMYWYLQEIIVLPEYQGQGIGRRIVNRLLEHIKEHAMPGTAVEIGLTAVKGKEPFYEKFGFSCGSSGMKKWLEIDR